MKAFFIRTLLILVSVVLLVQLWIFSSLVWWRTQPVQSTMMMRLDYWAEPSKPIQHQWRDYDQLSDNLKRAVVTAEDGKFMQHHGFDYRHNTFFVAQDIDIRCVWMAYIQLSLYGIPAMVIHGNTLTMEEWDRWYTPYASVPFSKAHGKDMLAE